MTRALRFTRSEIANAALVAKEHGVSVKLDRDGSILFIPDNHNRSGLDERPDEVGSSLRDWRNRHGNKAHGHP